MAKKLRIILLAEILSISNNTSAKNIFLICLPSPSYLTSEAYNVLVVLFLGTRQKDLMEKAVKKPNDLKVV